MNRMKKLFVLLMAAGAMLACRPEPGTIEVYAELKENPGNLTVTAEGRVFASVHQFRPGSARVVEVSSDGSMKPYPDSRWNALPSDGSTDFTNKFRSVLGLQVDQKNRLWILDNGLGEPAIAPRLFAFDLANNELVLTYEFSAEVAAPGSFLNDLAVDAERGYVYIADIGGGYQPGLVVVKMADLAAVTGYRYTGAAAFEAENADVVVDGTAVKMGGQPARIGLNPITLSADGETLFFGAMSGTSYYGVATRELRATGAAVRDAQSLTITRVGPKPVSDGASTDRSGRHYFTNLANNSIDVLETRGELRTLAKDDRLLNWPDALSFDGEGWLYVATNRLHLSPPLNGGTEGAPDGGFYIVRIATDARGVPGR